MYTRWWRKVNAKQGWVLMTPFSSATPRHPPLCLPSRSPNHCSAPVCSLIGRQFQQFPSLMSPQELSAVLKVCQKQGCCHFVYLHWDNWLVLLFRWIVPKIILFLGTALAWRSIHLSQTWQIETMMTSYLKWLFKALCLIKVKHCYLSEWNDQQSISGRKCTLPFKVNTAIIPQL